MDERVFLIIASVLVAANIAFAAYSYYAQRNLKRLREQFQEGSHISNLEEILNVIGSHIKRLDKEQKQLHANVELTKQQLGLAFQKIGVHRFNALADEGGNLSFTIALLNEHNSGFVITSLHNRDNTRIYAKPIEQSQSTSQLTSEEITALEIARKSYVNLSTK